MTIRNQRKKYSYLKNYKKKRALKLNYLNLNHESIFPTYSMIQSI